MGIFSPSVSVTPYFVEGKLQEPIIESVAIGLKKASLEEIDNQSSDKAVGWVCFKEPFATNFDNRSFLIANYFIFSLRIDKKTISKKIITKYINIETVKRLKSSGRDFLSRSEKKEIKENVISSLYLKIPSTPNIYDLIWNYESNSIFFFSNLKSANEDLENLFSRSFNLKLIRLFPYTRAIFAPSLTAIEKDFISKLKPTLFME